MTAKNALQFVIGLTFFLLYFFGWSTVQGKVWMLGAGIVILLVAFRTLSEKE